MAQKNFWAWLNMGKDGQPIEGESGSGQQYFAAKERKPSKLWNVAYWTFYGALVVVMAIPFIFVVSVSLLAAVVLDMGEAFGERIDSVLNWLDEKRG